MARVASRVHGLDATAGAEIEGAIDGARDHQAAQRVGRPADAEDVVFGEGTLHGDLAEVGGDPPVRLARGVDEGVRPEVDGGPDDVAVDLDEGELERPRDAEGREGGLDVVTPLRVAQDEELRQRVGRPLGVGRGGAALESSTGRDALAPEQRGAPGCTPGTGARQADDSEEGVVEVGSERGDE